MDNAHVAILELTLPASWFDTYNLISAAESVQLGFNATFLHRILSSRDKNQQIHLVHSEEDTDLWLIQLTCVDDSENQNTKPYFDKHFELPLIDIEEQAMQIPEIEYAAELAMLSAQFAGIVTQLKMFGDTMEVQCSEERIALASTSQDQGKMFVEIGINDLSEFAIDEGADLSLSFSLTYLKHICAYSKISNSVSIKFSDSYPMRVAYGLGEEEDALLVFHLAPKIND
jgi:proliferating cell nuclear antigen PCNA